MIKLWIPNWIETLWHWEITVHKLMLCYGIRYFWMKWTVTIYVVQLKNTLFTSNNYNFYFRTVNIDKQRVNNQHSKINKPLQDDTLIELIK